MKHYLPIYLVLFLMGSVTSCHQEPSLQFEQLQPHMGQEEESFPSALWGHYQNTQDSTRLVLTASAVVQVWYALFPLAIQELEQDTASYKVEKGWFYSSKFPKGLQVQHQTADSLFLYMPFADTLFVQDTRHRLRKIRNVYVLNQQMAPNRWKTFCLQAKSRNTLQLSRLDDSLDQVHLQGLHPLKKADNYFLANPSRKTFRKFLRQGGFRQREIFRRIAT